jgi:signal transduction histidine kinase/CheY-like chemotaxis protein
MLSLLPNVKNLTELSDMELSMGNLPLHSCQREAVLLGEHSASEVKLTNHLDMLHRDLIDSMEQQIKDRTAELAMANQDLERANTKVQKQSARQLEHFACMSHEIRTPLNCIVGMSSILLEETHSKIDPMITESIEMIYNSGELLRAVVDDVLDYAKLESGSFEVDVSKINLQESLAGVVYSISQKIQEKNIRLRCYFSPDLPKFTETDSRRLQQVLFNLLGNSGKFSKRNSVIDLSVKLVPKSTKDKRERLVVDGQGDANELHDCDIIRFSVQDYGKGIEKKDFKTIFQPFSQASKHTATVYGGTGLGLSITSKLVHSLGGRIAVDSEIGKFTEFIVDLPLKGEPVDIAAVKGRLKDVCIITVKPKGSIDYSFTTYPIAEEPEPFGSSVRDQYGLSVVSTQSVNDLEERVKQLEAEKSGKHFALLVNETLYDDQALTAIVEKLGHRNCTFMTFGPKNGIEATKQKHFRSLLGVFPSILLESIAKHVAHTKQDVVASDTKGSSALKSNPNSSSPDVAYVPEKAPKTSDPRSQRAESTKPTSAAKQFPPKRDLKVLYAEDNKINQKVLSRVLNRVGIMDVTIVDDGLKAVTICEKVSYDVIFMDMQMPVMDGVEACNLIIERDNDAKVIFVTAHALDEFKHKAKAAGGVGFISKPFRIEDIEKVLGQLDLDGKRNRRL